MPLVVRTARESERAAADRVASRAFGEYEREFPDWIPILRDKRPMTQLAMDGELVVAEEDGVIMGAVGYLAPGRSKESVFRSDWAVLRMMAVDPAHRGKGLARILADECARRARRDGAAALALYTSPAMTIAIAMYKRMGFKLQRAIPPVIGMPAELYTLEV
jgi:ribosomal protein S18 acetylase RimI-like enzyme